MNTDYFTVDHEETQAKRLEQSLHFPASPWLTQRAATGCQEEGICHPAMKERQQESADGEIQGQLQGPETSS